MLLVRGVGVVRFVAVLGGWSFLAVCPEGVGVAVFLSASALSFELPLSFLSLAELPFEDNND